MEYKVLASGALDDQQEAIRKGVEKSIVKAKRSLDFMKKLTVANALNVLRYFNRILPRLNDGSIKDGFIKELRESKEFVKFFDACLKMSNYRAKQELIGLSCILFGESSYKGIDRLKAHLQGKYLQQLYADLDAFEADLSSGICVSNISPLGMLRYINRNLSGLDDEENKACIVGRLCDSDLFMKFLYDSLVGEDKTLKEQSMVLLEWLSRQPNVREMLCQKEAIMDVLKDDILVSEGVHDIEYFEHVHDFFSNLTYSQEAASHLRKDRRFVDSFRKLVMIVCERNPRSFVSGEIASVLFRLNDIKFFSECPDGIESVAWNLYLRSWHYASDILEYFPRMVASFEQLSKDPLIQYYMSRSKSLRKVVSSKAFKSLCPNEVEKLKGMLTTSRVAMLFQRKPSPPVFKSIDPVPMDVKRPDALDNNVEPDEEPVPDETTPLLKR